MRKALICAATVALRSGWSSRHVDIATGGYGQDTFYGDPGDTYGGFEKVIINGVCKTGC